MGELKKVPRNSELGRLIEEVLNVGIELPVTNTNDLPKDVRKQLQNSEVVTSPYDLGLKNYRRK